MTRIPWGRLFLLFSEIRLVHGFLPQSREVPVPSWHNLSCVHQLGGCAVWAAVNGNGTLLRSLLFEPHTAALPASFDAHFCSMRQYPSPQLWCAAFRSPKRVSGRARLYLPDDPRCAKAAFGPVSELGSLVLSQKHPRVIVRVKLDFFHWSSFSRCPLLSDTWLVLQDFSQPLTDHVSLSIVKENRQSQAPSVDFGEEKLLLRSLVRVLDVVPRMRRLMLHLIQNI